MNDLKMKSKTTRRPSFLAKPGGMGRRKEMAMLLPPKRSLAYHEHGVEVDEKRIEVDWRDGSGRGRSKLVKMWECGEESSKRGVRGDPGSVKVKVGEEKMKVGDQKRKLSGEGRKMSDEKRKVSDEKRKVSDEKRKVSDEKRKVSDERRKLSDERRRQMSEKAKEEGREKLSQFIRTEIVYPHLLQVRFSIPIYCSFTAIF